MTAARSGVWAAEAPASERARFVALYRSQFAFTWSALRRLGVPPAAMDDAAQELWVTAHRRLDQLQDPRGTRSWLYAIARRVASHHRRSEHRHRRKLDAIEWSAAPVDAAEGAQSALIVESILDGLDPRVREAFVLSEIEGWTAPEIARATGANTNTIYWRVRVARQELQTQLAANDGPGFDAAVIQLREATQPPKGAAKHCWLVLAPQLGKGSAIATAVSSFGAWKLAVTTFAVAAVTAVSIDVASRDPVPERPTEPTTEVVARPERAAAAIVPADVDVPAPLPAPIAPAAAPIVPPVAIAPAAAPAPSSAATTRREPPAKPPAAPPSAPVVDEATLLGDAQLAFVGGDPARARALLQTHAREFPDSKLLDVRDLLEARVLCAEGRGDAARALAQRVADRAPGSAAAKKAAGICPAAKEQP